MIESNLTYCFDLDETLCHSENKDYLNARPIPEMIKKVNYLYDLGKTIKIFTARGMGKYNGDIQKVNNSYLSLTKKQLFDWGIKYHELILGKPSYDIFVDDKNITIDYFKKTVCPIVGFTAGCFDVIHPGYIELFKTMRQKCDYVLVALHTDPTSENKKIRPILSAEDRKNTLLSLKYVDEVLPYDTEEQLLDIMTTRKIDYRFLGDDYLNKKYTGDSLDIKIIYVDRSHGWSSTLFKHKIVESMMQIKCPPAIINY